MEAEAASYELFFRDEGGYADRAYAGKAYRISKLYEETGKAEHPVPALLFFACQKKIPGNTIIILPASVIALQYFYRFLIFSDLVQCI